MERKKLLRFKNIFSPLFKENGMETDSGDQQPDIADTSDLKNKEPKPKSAESIAERIKIKRQKESDDKQSDTPEQTKNFIDFLNQIKKEQHYISMSLYKKFFFITKHLMRWYELYTIQKVKLTKITSLIETNFKYFASKVKEMPKDARTEKVKILVIFNEILKVNEKKTNKDKEKKKTTKIYNNLINTI